MLQAFTPKELSGVIGPEDLAFVERLNEIVDEVNIIAGGIPAPVLYASFLPEFSGNTGNRRVRAVGATGLWRFNFAIPKEAGSVTSIKLIGIPDATFTDQSIWHDSDYAKAGEGSQNHVESDHASLFSGNLGEVTEWDITGVFSAVEAGDKCGIMVDHKGIGTNIDYLEVEVGYEVG